MIWLAVVGSINQSNVMPMMSLLWWGAVTNHNSTGAVGVYCRSLPQEFTKGGYHGRLLWEFTMGVYCRRLPCEFTMEGYCRSLLWEVTMGGYCGRLTAGGSGLDWILYLPLVAPATIDLVSGNREFEVWGIFWGVIPILGDWYSQNFQGPSSFVCEYHWLPLATIDLVHDNKEFQVWGIFWGLITILGAY